MPQMEVADFAPQIVWLIVTFGLMYLLMARLALPRIAQVLDARERRRTSDLEQAETLQKEAQQALAEFERVQAQTHNQAQAIATQTRNEMATKQAERLAELGSELAKQHKKSEAEIIKATETAMSGLSDLATELAQAAAIRLIGGKISADDARTAVDAQLKERGKG
jgi:F-type H+-transporting ATPase subunit b